MLTRTSLLAGGVIRGPHHMRRRNAIPIIHASMRPAHEHNIDFSQLGLTFPLTHPIDNLTKTGWSDPPKERPRLPFYVERTHVGASIPVYTEYKGARTKVITILRKCGGDIGALKDEMEKVCEAPVLVRPGKLMVEGNYVMRLKKWLTGLGF